MQRAREGYDREVYAAVERSAPSPLPGRMMGRWPINTGPKPSFPLVGRGSLAKLAEWKQPPEMRDRPTQPWGAHHG